MKKLITILFLIFSLGVFAQNVPQGINYQAVARDATGTEITSAAISVRFSIGNASVTNSAFNYQETHAISTNQFGLFNTVIGQGTPSVTSAAFGAIGWNIPQYLLVEIDFGSGFEQMGVATPFVTVPYSFLAKDVLNKELPPSATVNDVLSWNGTTWTAVAPSSVSETTTTLVDNTDGTFTYTNELGTPVVFDANIDDADADITNEIQDLSLSANILTITNNGAATPIDLSIYNELPTATGVGQVVVWNGSNWTAATPTDPSPTNELQNLSISGNDITISGGTGTTLASNTPASIGQVLTWNGTTWIAQNPGSGADNWGSQTVVSDATLTGNGTAGSPLSGFDGDYSNLSNTPTIPTNTSDLTNDSGFLTSEVDGSTTNEIQDLTISGNNLNITGGTGTTIASNSPSNGQILTWNNTSGAWEAQTLTSSADNWGSQTVVSDATLTGNGTAGSPLSGFDGDYGSLTNTPTIPTDTDNQTIDVFQLNASVLELSLEDDGVATQTLDLSPIADQTVTLTGASGITVAGTYPNFTLTNSTTGDTDWTQGAGITYNTSDNIGIGTSSPSQLLQIEDNITPVVYIKETTPTGGAIMMLESQKQWMLHSNESGDFKVTDNTASQERITIDGATGNIGLSNAVPSSRLDVVSNSFNLLKLSTTAANSNVNVDISPSGSGSAQFRMSNATGGYLFYTTNGGINPVIKATDNNRVGIDLNTLPLSAMDVNGQITMRAGAGTAGYIPVSDVNGTMTWTDPASLNDGDWIKTAGVIYNSTDKVGVGLNNPVGQFDVSTSTLDRGSQIQNSTNSSGDKYGIYANASGGGTGDNSAGWFDAFGSGTGVNTGAGGQALGSSGENRGIYGAATGGTTNWAGYFEMGNVHIQNKLGVGTLLPYYPLHIAQDVSDLTGNSGAFMAIQNSNNASGPGQIAGIRFRTDGVSVGDGRFKGGLYFEKTGSFGVGDFVFALNTTGSNANATLSDKLMRLSRDPATDGLELTTVTSGDAGSFNNSTLAGGTAVRATATSSASATGNKYGVYSTAWYGQSVNYGVYAYGYGGTTSYGIYANAGGGSVSNYAGYFTGNVNVTGTLSKGGGTFKIDHPLDPENKYLYHSFVESPDMMNIYNGNVVTDTDGYATIELPEYFESLNKDFRYQLTVLGSFAQAVVSKKVANNSFTIQTNQPNTEVSWQITGVRKDAWAEKNRVIPEVDKKGEEKGKYIHPDAFGVPAEKGIDYENSKLKTEQNN